MSAYQELESTFRRIRRIEEVSGILGWDMQAMMPSGGAEGRAAQMAELSLISHEIMTNPSLGEKLNAAADEVAHDETLSASVREMRRRHLHANAADARLVEEMTTVGIECTMEWREARKDNDFKRLEPKLTKIFALVRELGDATGAILGTSSYDALIDRFEPGMRAERIETIFAPLREELPELINEVIETQKSWGELDFPQGPFPPEKQREIGMQFMTALGFDFNHGRLDTSHHPFCGGVPEDVRITTRYDEKDFTSALMGVLHETGHALYERQLPRDWANIPMGEARGMGIHESQSLFVEMQICRSAAFVEWATPQLTKHFGGSGPAWNPENLQKIYRKVNQGLIRVDADEVTYPCHVILRFELEQALISGDLQVADLPDAWNAKMEKFLGVQPDTDAMGCMQDIHWMDGAVGYFPSYSLGALFAAQLYDAAEADIGGLDAQFRQGEFAPIMKWLGEKIHSQASRWETDDLIQRATGAPLSAEPFLKHVRTRYLEGRR